jgi:hypothetical protein
VAFLVLFPLARKTAQNCASVQKGKLYKEQEESKLQMSACMENFAKMVC